MASSSSSTDKKNSIQETTTVNEVNHDEIVKVENAVGSETSNRITLVSNEYQEDPFKHLRIFLLISLWTPLFLLESRNTLGLISWIGMLASMSYQIFHLYLDICLSLKAFPIPGVDNSTGRTSDIVANEKIYQITQLIASIIYLVTRGVIFFIFWIRRDNICEIFTQVTNAIVNDENSLKMISRTTFRICRRLYIVFVAIIVFYVVLFTFIPHDFIWFYLISRIYTSILITSILMLYYISIRSYQTALISFFHSISYDDVDIIGIRSELHKIKKLHEQIERKLGFFIFWIFCLNYIEIVWTVIVFPHLSQFDMRNRDCFLWVMSISRSIINLITIIITVVKVDSQKWTTDLLFRDFERAMVEQSTDTDIILLVMDVKDAIDLRFTAWLGFIQIDRSVLISYLVNLIVYGNLLFEFVHWAAH